MPVVLRLLLGFAVVAAGPARALAQPAAPVEKPAAPGDDRAIAPGDKPADADGADDASAPDKATVIVKARTPTGAAVEDSAVKIDGRPMGGLEDGEAILLDVPEGRHTITIEAIGYARFEQAVTVHPGERVTVAAPLVVQVPPPPPPRSALWTASLSTSIAFLAAGGAYGLYSVGRMRTNNDAVRVVAAPRPEGGYWADPKPISTADCGKDAATIAREKHSIVVNQPRLDRMCTWNTRVYVSFGIAGLGLIGGFISMLALTHEHVVQTPAPPPMTSRGQVITQRGRKREIAIVPIVGPDGGGAWLSLSW